MKSKILSTGSNNLTVDAVLLVLRVVIGLSFAYYGSFKIQNPMHWMGEESTFPGIIQALAAISEFCGGIALIAGFLTRVASFGIACTMIVATYMHLVVNGDPFVNFTGGGSYDHALQMLVVAVLFLLVGPGRFSVDRLVFGKY